MKIIRLLLLALTGLMLGVISALWMSGLIGLKGSPASFTDINVEGWTSDRSIGALSADPYTRARVARYGLLALAKEEAVYFTRKTDDEGDPLLEACRYELSGGPQNAFWWSITLYDADSRLPMNDDAALSVDATLVGDAPEWTALIAPARPAPVQSAPRHWLSSRAAGTFDLTLRLYRPSPDIIDTPNQALRAPKIRKLDCATVN